MAVLRCSMRVGILGSGLMGGKSGTPFARRARGGRAPGRCALATGSERETKDCCRQVKEFRNVRVAI